MPGAHQHLKIPAWSTWEQGWPVVRYDDQGVPHGVDLTGYKVRSQVRRTASDATVLHEWSSELGNAWIITRAVSAWDLYTREKYLITTDLAVLHVDPETSGAWTWNRGEWDLKLYAPEPGLWDDRIAEGTVETTPGVTRP